MSKNIKSKLIWGKLGSLSWLFPETTVLFEVSVIQMYFALSSFMICDELMCRRISYIVMRLRSRWITSSAFQVMYSRGHVQACYSCLTWRRMILCSLVKPELCTWLLVHRAHLHINISTLHSIMFADTACNITAHHATCNYYIANDILLHSTYFTLHPIYFRL